MIIISQPSFRVVKFSQPAMTIFTNTGADTFDVNILINIVNTPLFVYHGETMPRGVKRFVDAAICETCHALIHARTSLDTHAHGL